MTVGTPPGQPGVVPRAVHNGLGVVVVLAALSIGATSGRAAAEERYAIVVAGASGGAEYATQYSRWSAALVSTLVDHMKLPPSHVTVLSDTTDPAVVANAVNVRRAFADVRRRLTPDDLLLVVLLGHGTFDGVDAKFNLVGADLESADWADLVAGLPGRIVFVNTTSASFPFIERLSGDRRIVITATDSAAQRFDTAFPEYFIQAFSSEEADIDKNGRVSIWEAFVAATRQVRRHYQQRGQLATERALLDDNGDGIGREAAGSNEDGSASSRVYLDVAAPGAPPTDEVLLGLLQRRASLELEAEELKVRRAFLPPDQYMQEFERLMIELARINREIRERTKS